MSDLIERLRDTHECTAGFWNGDVPQEDRNIMLEAADEIESLRALLLECRKYVFIECSAAERTAEAYGEHPECTGRWLSRARKHQSLLDRIDVALGEKP